jgi:hypothetical protein
VKSSAALPLSRGHLEARVWLEPLAVVLLAGLLFSINLASAPEFDELYHVLAARGWVATGEPAIAGGAYERTYLFTVLVGGLFELMGDSLLVARLPSFTASLLLALLLFLWLRHRAGPATAWLAVLFFIFSPFTIDLAHFARFYALHALLFVAGAILLYEGLRTPRLGLRIALWLTAAGSLALAFYLQVTTLIGLCGLVLWFLLETLWPWLWARPAAQRRRLFAATAIAALLLLSGLLLSGLAASLLERFLASPEWARQRVGQIWFYHFWLVLYYPSLWPIFPLVFLAAFRAHPSLMRFSASIFLCALLLHSIASQKATRYISYALPFLYILFALALVELWPLLRSWTRKAIAALLPGHWPPPWRERLATSGLALALLFVIGANGALPRSLLMLASIRVPPQPPAEGWTMAAPILEPYLEDADVVVSTNELQTLYHLGRADITLSRSRLFELYEPEEFAPDPRTGMPVISTADSLARTMRCWPSGVLLSTDSHWRNETQLGDAVANLLVREAEPITLPRAAHIHAYRWEASQNSTSDESCPNLLDDP